MSIEGKTDYDALEEKVVAEIDHDTRGDEPVNGGGTFGGLTIREHLAGLAMNGLLANPSTEKEAVRVGLTGVNPADKMAQVAVAFVDSLLAELAGGTEGS